LLPRPEAEVPSGTRGRLGGFLSRRTRTLPVRVAAAQMEGPPEEAKPLREKRTFRRSGIGRKNAKRPHERDAGPAIGEDGLGAASCVRLGKRSRTKFDSEPGRTTPVFTMRFDMTARTGVDLHVHRGERNPGEPPANALAPGAGHRPPRCRRHLEGVKVHAFTVQCSPAAGERMGLPNSV